MKFKLIKFIVPILAFCFYAPVLSAAEDVDWIFGKEAIYEAGPESPTIGTRWALGTRKDDIQITFRLETSTDMKQGGWLGDVRAPEKFYVKVYLVDDAGVKRYFKLENGRAIGPDTEYGNWKEGPATADQQMLLFDFNWDQMQQVKKAKSIVLGYSPYDKRKDSQDITISLDSFTARLNELEASVKAVNEGTKFILTKEQIDTTPLNKLPASIREYWQDDLKQVSQKLSMPISELLKLSMQDIQKLQMDKAIQLKEAKLAQTRKAHQAIYDQEPEWFDINVCPKPDVGYCNNIGKIAYLEDSMIKGDGVMFTGAMTIRYGKIYGVIWRSKGSIIEIYPGDVKWDRDPRIFRAPKAEYYYIIKDGDQLKIKPSAGIYAKD